MTPPRANWISLKQLLTNLLTVLGLLSLLTISSPSDADPVVAGPSSLVLSQESRTLLVYGLAAIGKTPDQQAHIFADLRRRMVDSFMRGPEVHAVESWDDFLREWRGRWPNAHSVEADIRLLQKTGFRPWPVYSAAEPDLQIQIDSFQTQQKFIAGVLVFQRATGTRLDLWNYLTEENQNQPLTERWSVIQNRILQLAQARIEAEFQEISATARKLLASKNGSTDPKKEILMRMMDLYFARLSLDAKKQIASELMNGDVNLTDLQKMARLLMNTGPQFQKLMQIMAREEGMNEDVRALMQTLESDVRPVAPALVEELIRPEMEAYGLVSYDPKPLGVGTMAQVHLATRRLANGELETVVIRFLKPDIEQRVEDDNRILTEIAPLVDSDLLARGLPALGPLVPDLSNTVRKELYLEQTVLNQTTGRVVYTNDLTLKGGPRRSDRIQLQIRVPEVIPGPVGTRLIVQSLADGTKLDKAAALVAHSMPQLKPTVAVALARAWLDEVLFGTGFFHSDLHPGNLVVAADADARRVVATLLDFGMVGQLSEIDRALLMALGAAVETNDARLATESLWNLAVSSDITKAQLGDAVYQEMRSAHVLGKRALGSDLFMRSMNLGLHFKESLISADRAMTIIEKMLSDSGATVSLSDLQYELVSRHPIMTFQHLRKSKLLSFLDIVRIWYETQFSRMKEPKPPKLSQGNPPSPQLANSSAPGLCSRALNRPTN